MKLGKIAFIGYLLLTLITLIFFLFPKLGVTGETVKQELFSYSYTRAICNESNSCQDYEIVCNGEEIVSLNPITGAVIQHDSSWEDPRKNTSEKDYCNNS